MEPQVMELWNNTTHEYPQPRNKEIYSGMALPSERDWIDDEPYTNLSP